MRFIYTALIELLAPLAFILTLVRGLKDRGYWERGYERFGFGRTRSGPPCLWLHAVSLGEVNAAAPLIRALQVAHPEAPLLLTTATPAGRARARALFESCAEVRYLPYDTPGAVHRFLRRTRPGVALILETELWPNLIAACRRRGIAVGLVSARITSRSLSRYRRFGALFRDSLAGLAFIAAQSEADAERFLALGAPRASMHVTGNLKLELEPDAALRARGAKLRALMLGGRPTWVAGSTHEGEEEQALEAHRGVCAALPDALLVLVPRHAQRFERIAELLTRRGLSFDRLSAVEAVRPGSQVLLVDRMGELMALYAAADVAFVGGSLVPVGGHNLLEPASLGVAVLTGPHTSSNAQIARGLLESGGARLVSDSATLAAEVLALLRDPERREAQGAAARAYLEQQRGSLRRVLELLEPWLKAVAQGSATQGSATHR
jgi:3-deoxy-D-manno-octulosonic-acid transferase